VTITIQCGINSNVVNSLLQPETFIFPRAIAESNNAANPNYVTVVPNQDFMKSVMFSLTDDKCGWDRFTIT
jgi:hypothetical protein